MTPRPRLRRAAAILALGALVLGVGVAVLAWRSPPFYDAPAVALPTPIMSPEGYDSVSGTHQRPYVVRIAAGRGALVLFGAEHTRDPFDPQLDSVGAAWGNLRPTVALVEGRLGFLLPGLMDPVARYGEMGFTMARARAAGVPVYSWEPRREWEIARMLDSFPARRVALFYVLRPYFGQVRFARPSDPEGFVEEYRRKRTRYPGLQGSLPSVETIDSIWARDFPNLPDWRETSDEHGLPGYLGDLSARSNALRDEHLVAVIADLMRRGERVFAVAGSSHAVMLDGALHALLGHRATGGPPSRH